MKERFKAIAERYAQVRRDGIAAPQELFKKKIKTREVLDWLERREADTPSPEYTPDDPEARKHGEHENAKLAARMRRRFHQRSQKGREDFKLARDYKQRDRER